MAAYHVTCAVKEGLEMKTVMMQDKDDVQHIVSLIQMLFETLHPWMSDILR